MHLPRIAVLLAALGLGVALLAHASPVPRDQSLSARKTLKAAKAKAPLVKSVKIEGSTAVKTKTAPATAAKVKAVKAKTTKAKTTKAKAIAGNPTKAKGKTTNTQQNTNPACSRPGANRRAECATPAIPTTGEPAAPAGPVTPPEVDCTQFTTCGECVTNKCKFNTKNEKCSKTGLIRQIALSGEVAASAAQCKTFETKKATAAAAAEKKTNDQAEKILRNSAGHQSIIDHVVSGPQKPVTSGRHLFSRWSKNTAIAATAQKDATTQLAQLDLKSLGASKKTVWIDGTDGYSNNDVLRMCRDAIAAVIKTDGSFKNKAGVDRSHHIVVAGFGGNKVCLTVNEESCFPKRITPAAGDLGSTC